MLDELLVVHFVEWPALELRAGFREHVLLVWDQLPDRVSRHVAVTEHELRELHELERHARPVRAELNHLPESE